MRNQYTYDQKAMSFVLLIAALLGSPGVTAQSVDEARQAAQTRQSVLKLMGWNMGPLGAMARGRIPFDAGRVATNAGRMVALAEMLPESFGVDTRNTAIRTDALDLIWEQESEFADKARNTLLAAQALNAVAAGGNESEIRRAIGKLGQSCGDCHDRFKSD